MGLDLGTRKIGVAVSDPLGISVRPLTTIVVKSQDDAIDSIVDLISEFEVALIVAGRPQHMDGETAEVFEKLEPIGQAVSHRSGVPLQWTEERLSTREAERVMVEAGLTPSERRQRRDEFAAALILQWYLNERL